MDWLIKRLRRLIAGSHNSPFVMPGFRIIHAPTFKIDDIKPIPIEVKKQIMALYGMDEQYDKVIAEQNTKANKKL